jgi:hypothetical protein
VTTDPSRGVADVFNEIADVELITRHERVKHAKDGEPPVVTV